MDIIGSRSTHAQRQTALKSVSAVAWRKTKHTLPRQYDRDLKEANISLTPQWEDITAAAQLRDEWRGFVDALRATNDSGVFKV